MLNAKLDTLKQIGINGNYNNDLLIFKVIPPSLDKLKDSKQPNLDWQSFSGEQQNLCTLQAEKKTSHHDSNSIYPYLNE